ncbi:4,5-DOPA dioxygenase extradiol [Neisseria sp. HSC-16F19]|nr:4,5-DOPA dioxygenase extradiol [Neisseria sp. HSC-16F19]MCP2040848.1 4,5-DOPA dioxygenase extradiol [Neisseria sp. HSC-16F19]
MKLPFLFIGHGSPMNAITDTRYSRNWRTLGAALRQQYGGHIRAVLAVSAHWCTRGSAVTAMAEPRTIHDFGGFPQALFEVQYPAPGSPELAAQVRSLLGEDVVADDHGWGLDHGSWSVLCHLFPDAGVPVVQLSLDAGLDSAAHYALARRLAPLREQGVLMVASGSIVHNLRQTDRSAPDEPGRGYDWAESARLRVNDWLLRADHAALTNEAAYPADLRLAAPTPDHWWPLLYAAALADADEKPLLFNDEMVGKSLSMTSAVWGAVDWTEEGGALQAA